MSTLIITDTDGFKTEWAWPEGKTMLANAEFVASFEGEHWKLRLAQGAGPGQLAGYEVVP